MSYRLTVKVCPDTDVRMKWLFRTCTAKFQPGFGHDVRDSDCTNEIDQKSRVFSFCVEYRADFDADIVYT